MEYPEIPAIMEYDENGFLVPEKETMVDVVREALDNSLNHPGIIFVYCAWCGLYLEAIDGQGTTGNSHGLCSDCYKILKEERS
ncbi:MAG: hypothetical protein WC346_00340 [Methanogenium sp.]|jgi:hypothetical protein